MSAMFPAMPAQANKHERKLIKIFKSLDDSNKEAFMAFGEFLLSRFDNLNTKTREDNQDAVSMEPVDIPRPEGESVIKAIKRLSATYPMVDKENILHPISDLMTSHMISGRAAPEVIDDLQEVFLNEYKSLRDE
jgi:hypothetical protein